MTRSLLRRLMDEEGASTVLLALMMPLFLGMSALTIDMAAAFVDRRELQNAADAAAHAGAYELKIGGGPAAAIVAAQDWAEQNGLSDPIVNVPPQSGPHAGDSDYVEVIGNVLGSRFFSRLFFFGDINIRARAVAGIKNEAVPYSMIVLDNSLCQAYNQTGSGNLQAENSVQVNSDCPTDAFRTQASGNTETTQLNVTGGASISGSGNVIPGPITGAAVVPDPMTAVPYPSGLPIVSTKTLNLAGGGDQTIGPGVYIGGIKIPASSNITMLPGVYVMQGGGFELSGSGNVLGSGVMIYNTCDTGNCALGGTGGELKFSGSGNLEITPATSGDYRNLLLFQDRALTERVLFSGSGNLVASGTIYAPNALFDMSGSGNSYLQLIVGTFAFSGSGNLQLRYDDQWFYEPARVFLVE